jgi:hypothetical protein
MILTLDSIEGTNSASRTPQGWEIQRAALVDGLGGAPASRMTRALRCPGLPTIGSPHPDAPGAVLDRIEVVADDRTTDRVRLALTYRTLNPETADPALGPSRDGVKVLGVELFSTTQTERTNLDAAGREMIAVFKGTWYNADGSTAPFTVAWDEVQADVFRPQLGVRIRHERPALPRDLAADYVGAVNSDAWSGFKPGTWLITSLAAESGSGAWVATLEALYRPLGWQLTHIMKIDGRVPSAAVRGNGIETFQIYRPRRFAKLGVAF